MSSLAFVMRNFFLIYYILAHKIPISNCKDPFSVVIPEVRSAWIVIEDVQAGLVSSRGRFLVCSTAESFLSLNGTQSRNPYTSLSGKSAMNLIN